MYRILFPFICLTLCAFVSVAQNQSYNRFHDPIQRKIANWTDQHEVDSLISACSYPSAVHRREAAYAFASVQDARGVKTLIRLLRDTDQEVVLAAIYAMGQIADSCSLSHLVPLMNTGQPQMQEHALESIGKILAKSASDSTYTRPHLSKFAACSPNNAVGEAGWAKGLLWMHLAGIQDSVLMHEAVLRLPLVDASVRFSLASALGRYRGNWLKVNSKDMEALFSWAEQETDESSVATFLPALVKMNAQRSSALVNRILISHQPSTMLLLAALRSCGKLNTIPASSVSPWLVHENPTVVSEALGALYSKDYSESLSVIRALGHSQIPTVAAMAWKIISSYDSAPNSQDLQDYLAHVSDPYLKSELIRHVEMQAEWIPLLRKWALESTSPVIKTACVERILTMTMDQDIDDFVLEVIENGDPGCIAILTPDLIKHPHHDYDRIIEQLEEYSHTLELPQDMEVLLEIQKLLPPSSPQKFDQKKLMNEHPLNWERIQSIPANQRVEVNTTSGSFVMELHVDDAPGSVCSFVELAKSHYFDHKFVHRLVPNFVAQTGCPRGDGFGSVPYLLRSEFKNHEYLRGAVGLASAGKDTESCQWFIGLTPCLTLEGRYTIFAQVISGMDVVERLYIGSQIHSIAFIPN